MAQFTFADEDSPSPSAPPPPKPEAAPPTPSAAPAPKPPGGFSFVDADAEEEAPAPPTPAKPPAPPVPVAPQILAPPPGTAAPSVAPPQAPAPQPPQAGPRPGTVPSPPSAAPGGAPRAPGVNPIPAPPGAPSAQRAPQVPVVPQAPAAPVQREAQASPQAPAAPAAPQVLAGANAPARSSDNPVRDAARQAAQAPDRGAAAGMVGGAIPNVAGQRPPSPPLPNQASNPAANAASAPQAPTVQAPTPPQAPAAPKPTTARQAAAQQASAQRAAQAPPVPPTVHAITPGMAAPSAITPDVNFAHQRDWRSELSRFDPQMSWLFRVAAIAAVLSLGYIILGLMGGAGNPDALNNPTTRVAALQFTGDIRLASIILHWALLIAAVTTLLLAMDVAWVGPILAAVGVLLHFGAPIFLNRMGTLAAANVAVTLRGTGLILLVVGLGKYSIDFLRWLQDMPNRVKSLATVGSAHKAEAKQQLIARTATMFSPCWHLPFCREVIRLQCPAYLARQRCWKFGRGCYCDEEMIGRIIRGESLDKIKAPTVMSTKKPPCGRCHIFLEHQGLKYKMMAPLAVPATLITMFLGWPLFTTAFMGLNSRMQALWNLMTFDKSRFTPDVLKAADGITSATNAGTELSAERTAQYGLWIFGILAGFFLLIYISKFIEWAILQKKW